MKKLLMFAGIAFVVSAAAGAGIRVAVTPKPPPPPVEGELAPGALSEHAAEKAADPAGEPGSAHATDGSAITEDGVDAGHAGTDSSVASGAAPGEAEPAGAASVEAAPAQPIDPATIHASVESKEFKEVARILINMKATEAVQIMGHLSDEQVLGILRSMGVRQAAAILAKLPSERAGSISRRLLEPDPEGE